MAKNENRYLKYLGGGKFEKSKYAITTNPSNEK